VIQGGRSDQQVAAVFDIRSPGCIAKWDRQYRDGGMELWRPAHEEVPTIEFPKNRATTARRMSTR
jgi:hypothetical protein